MPTIYVIEQLIDKEWVGIQTNFFNSPRNKKISPYVEKKLAGSSYEMLEDPDKICAMAKLINKLSPYFSRGISVDDYKAIVLDSISTSMRKRIILEHLVTGKGTNELIGMPPEFDTGKMRFLWWSGDYACTPVAQRNHPLRCLAGA